MDEDDDEGKRRYTHLQGVVPLPRDPIRLDVWLDVHNVLEQLNRANLCFDAGVWRPEWRLWPAELLLSCESRRAKRR